MTPSILFIQIVFDCPLKTALLFQVKTQEFVLVWSPIRGIQVTINGKMLWKWWPVFQKEFLQSFAKKYVVLMHLVDWICFLLPTCTFWDRIFFWSLELGYLSSCVLAIFLGRVHNLKLNFFFQKKARIITTSLNILLLCISIFGCKIFYHPTDIFCANIL